MSIDVSNASNATRNAAVSTLDRARSAWRQGAYDQAIWSFREAAQAPDASAQLPLVKALVSLWRFDEAAAVLEGLLAVDGPQPAEAVLLNALMAFRDGRCPTALTALEELVDQTRHPAVRVALKQLCAVSGRERSGALADFPSGPFEGLHQQALEMMPAPVWKAFSGDVLDAGIEAVQLSGSVVECGVYHGRSIRHLASRLTLDIHGFDSFEGLPERWGRMPAGAYSTGRARPSVPDHVHLHAGWFEETLPQFSAARGEMPIALLHIDCDLYSSTATALQTLGSLLVPGSVVVFDDYFGYPDFEHHEYLAWQEFLGSSKLRARPIAAAVAAREAAFVLE